MIRSPGVALSMADCSGLASRRWNRPLPGLLGDTYVGDLPPTVIVTVSIDFLPLAAVITSCAQRVLVETLRCCTVQVDALDGMLGTTPLMTLSLQDTPVSGRATPSLPTSAT